MKRLYGTLLIVIVNIFIIIVIILLVWNKYYRGKSNRGKSNLNLDQEGPIPSPLSSSDSGYTNPSPLSSSDSRYTNPLTALIKQHEKRGGKKRKLKCKNKIKKKIN